MNNHERYRAAFRGVKAPEGAAERVLERPQTPEPAFSAKRRLPVRTALIAAAVAALLVGSAGAEVANGSVSNLLAPLYGGAQTEIVDGIGVPLDASVSVNGYTLTADAVIGDRYHMIIVYTLTRDDGEPIPAGLHFREHSNTAASGSGGGSLSGQPDPDHPNQVHIVEDWGSAAPLWKYASISFQDLVLPGQEEYTYETVAEGTWKLGFPLRYRDATVSVPAEGLMVTGSEGYEYELKKIELSPIGIHMDLMAPNTLTGDADSRILPDFQFSLRMADGRIMGVKTNGAGGGGSLDDKRIKADYEARFDLPAALADMEALIICDTEIPLNLS